MAGYSTFRAAVADCLAALPQMGTVHRRERLITDWAKYLAEFAATIAGKREVRGWWVTRERVSAEFHTFGAAPTLNRVHLFVARGVVGVQDAADSDAGFGDLIDQALDALDELTISGAWNVGPCSARVIEARQFGSVLCHYVEIEVPVAQEVTA